MTGFASWASNSLGDCGLRQPSERGQKQQRQLVLGPAAPDLAREGEPVHLRHHHVEHGDVEPLARPRSARAPRSGSSTATGSIPHERACRVTISRFVALSSTTRIRLPRELRQRVVVRDLRRHLSRLDGSAMWKVDPLPSSLSTRRSSRPSARRGASRWRARARSAVAARRRGVDLAERREQPVHPVLRDPDAGVPNRELELGRSRPAGRLGVDERRRPRPASVNLTAFESRLSSTWRRRAASPTIPAGASSSMRQPSSISFSHARGATMSSAPSTHSRRSNGSCSSSSLPASIFE